MKYAKQLVKYASHKDTYAIIICPGNPKIVPFILLDKAQNYCLDKC